MQEHLFYSVTNNRLHFDQFSFPGRKFLFLFLIGLLASTSGWSQSDTLQSMVRQLAKYEQETLPEKLYVHLDRPAYASGETMWFKIYYVDGLRHHIFNLSKIAYIEVLNQEQQAVLQGKIALQAGTGNGSFPLPASLASGHYTVRAYTSRMKNFNPDFYFEKQVTIINTTTPVALTAKTDTAGFTVAFFPEGGNLVENLPSKIAFKVTDKKGRGLAVTGTIVDAEGKTVTTFKTLKFGIGAFTFTPAPQTRYTALIQPPNQAIIRQPLPQVFAQGYVMRLDESDPENITITVQAKLGALDYSETIYLLGHARGAVSVAASASLQNGQAVFSVRKNKIATGISHFTLFNAAKKPVCERLYFVRPATEAKIVAQTDKPAYEARDKVTLAITTPALVGPAVSTHLSVAVYRADSLSNETTGDINSYFWLSSDLRGTVENPGYYFTNTEPDIREATDNLMLTHGWSRFRWEDVFTSKLIALAFPPEINGHFVRGRITNAQTGAPATGITTYAAFPGRNIRFYNTTSKENGRFQFEIKDNYGPQELVVQTNTTQDSIYQLQLDNPFSEVYATRAATPFMVTEQLKQTITLRHLQMQVQNAYYAKYLNQYKRPVQDTLAFYGKPDEKYLLDRFTRFKVMEEVMREYVPGVVVRIRKDGFHFLVSDKTNQALFLNNPLVLLDGVPVFDIDKIMAFDPLKIRQLDVVTRRYFQGPQSFEGVVSYITYGNDLGGFALDARALVQEYEGMQRQREFYAPRYDTPALRQSRLPDYRNLLYWNPAVISPANTPQNLEFYTGDQPGRYMVVVQGLSENGFAGSSTFTFDVKQAW